jgi:hypothetical protein
MKPFQKRISSVRRVVDKHTNGTFILNGLQGVSEGDAMAQFIHAFNKRRRNRRTASSPPHGSPDLGR